MHPFSDGYKNVKAYRTFYEGIYLSISFANQGLVYNKLNNFEQALDGYDKSITILSNLGSLSPTKQQTLASHYRQRGDLFIDLNKMEKALLDFNLSIAILESVVDFLGEQAPHNLKNSLISSYLARSGLFFDIHQTTKAKNDNHKAVILSGEINDAKNLPTSFPIELQNF